MARARKPCVAPGLPSASSLVAAEASAAARQAVAPTQPGELADQPIALLEALQPGAPRWLDPSHEPGWSSDSIRLRIRSNRLASPVFRRPSGPIYPRCNIAALRELRPVGCRQATIVSETPYPRFPWPALVDRLGWPARGALAALDPHSGRSVPLIAMPAHAPHQICE